MGTYFDINGTAMIYINTNPSIRKAKTKKGSRRRYKQTVSTVRHNI